jgi:hypothetical protein
MLAVGKHRDQPVVDLKEMLLVGPADPLCTCDDQGGGRAFDRNRITKLRYFGPSNMRAAPARKHENQHRQEDTRVSTDERTDVA